MYTDEDEGLDSELLDEESSEFTYAFTEASITKKKGINMDARRKIEQIREERALAQQFAYDFWEEKTFRNC